jgi:hypothetical protein
MTNGFKNLSEGQTKALRKFIIAFVIVFIVGGVLATMKANYRRYNPDPLQSSEVRNARDPMRAVRNVTVGGQELTIPIPYFFHRVPLEGEESSVLLAVSYPEFEPLTKSHRRSGHHFLHVRMLLMSPVGKRSIQYLHDSRMRSFGALDSTDTTNGLPRYVPADRLKNELYPVEGTRDAITGFIDCTSSIHYPISDMRNPQCTYITARNGILYWIDFDKDLLSEFRRIQTKVFLIIDSFQHQ